MNFRRSQQPERCLKLGSSCYHRIPRPGVPEERKPLGKVVPTRITKARLKVLLWDGGPNSSDNICGGGPRRGQRHHPKQLVGCEGDNKVPHTVNGTSLRHADGWEECGALWMWWWMVVLDRPLFQNIEFIGDSHPPKPTRLRTSDLDYVFGTLLRSF